MNENETMIQELNIVKFRGLKSLNIKNLSRINVFVGANNCGKTSVLEAIKILSAPKDIGQLVTVALHRSGANIEQRKRNLVNYLLSVFQQGHESDEDKEKNYSIEMSMSMKTHLYRYDADGTIGDVINSAGYSKQAIDIAIGTSENNKKMTYETRRIINGEEYVFEPTERPIIKTLFVPSTINHYQSCVRCLSDYMLREGKADIMKILRSFDSDIEDISIIGEDIYLYNLNSGSLPLFAYGLGLQKAVLLSAIIVNFQDGVVLIDEIDNAIHVSAFENVFKWFVKACKDYNVQAFITTHSVEAIDAIISSANDECNEDNSLRIITLRNDAKCNITRYKMRDRKQAIEDREQFGMELRV